MKELTIFIIVLTSISLVFILFLFIKSSGKPYKSSFHKRRLRSLSIAVSSWAFLKLLRGIAGLWGNVLIDSLSHQSSSSMIIQIFNVLYCVAIVILDVIPVLLTLNSSISECFYKSN